MTDILSFPLAFVAGALLGTFFFVGLWWTIKKGVNSAHPAIWFLGSLVVRTGLILAGFYLVAQGTWSRLLMCVLGFVSAHIVVVKRLARTPVEGDASLAKEAGHAVESR